MSPWYKFRCTTVGAIMVLALISTSYYIPYRPLSVSSSTAVPIYRAYSGFSSLPNAYTDVKLGFVPHFVAFTFNWDMLNQSLRSLHESAVDWRNVILIDNSPGKLAISRRDWLEEEYGRMIITILPAPSFLSFSHLQNLFLTIADESDCQYYSWSHMDVILLPLYETWKTSKKNMGGSGNDRNSAPMASTVYSLFLNSIIQVNTTVNDWGLIFYSFDWLAAVRTTAYKSTGLFDIAIPQYKADCDYYKRLELQGYKAVNQRIAHIFHMPKALESKFTQEMKTCKWERAKEILDYTATNYSKKHERTAWRLVDMRTADREASSILTPAGWAYYKKKWGTDDCRPTTEPNWSMDAIIR